MLARGRSAACMFAVCTSEKRVSESLCLIPEIFMPSTLCDLSSLAVALLNVPCYCLVHAPLVTVICEHMFIKVKMFKQYVFVPGIIAKSEPEPLKDLTVSGNDDEKAKSKLFIEFPLLMNENKSSLAFSLHYRLHKSN